MSSHNDTNSGLCECGCGESTRVNREGVRNRFVFGHQRRQWQPVAPNPSGLCMCGCGQITPIAQTTDITYRIKQGEHKRYCMGHGPGPDLVIEHIDRGYKTPCWIPNRVGDRRDYRSNMVRGEVKKLHRRMYEEKHGPIPTGLVPDHLCRQHDCCNPDHIEPVTNAENTRRGLSAKLTADDVREIRRLASTASQSALAERYGVGRSQINRIIKGLRWADLP